MTLAPLRRQGVAQTIGATIRLAQLNLDTRHVGVGRDDEEARHGGFHRRQVDGTAVDDDVIDGRSACFTWNTQAR
ncbi:hypothetical protein D3C72_843460 [compost metagenome]